MNKELCDLVISKKRQEEKEEQYWKVYIQPEIDKCETIGDINKVYCKLIEESGGDLDGTFHLNFVFAVDKIRNK